jgi:glyoxylase-like metal-dependent hydrolase (beta-lactamase superfamily II)
VEEIAPGLWWWTASHPEWTPEDLEGGEGWEQIVSSYALAAGGAFVLFDPLVRDWKPLDRLVEDHGPPSVLLTILWHARSAQEILDRYKDASVWAYEQAAEWVGERTAVTNTFTIGTALPGGVEPVHMRRIEEVAYWISGQNSVVVGDTILGHADGAAMCPPTWVRTSETFEPAKESVRQLLERRPDRLLLTHGGPTDPTTLEV